MNQMQKQFDFAPDTFDKGNSNRLANRLLAQDRAVHDWYRFVLSFPAHIVRDYLCQWQIGPGSRVLDPFCGTGTTLIETKKMGVHSVGVEANPVAQFAATTKLDWSPAPDDLLRHARRIADATQEFLNRWQGDPLTLSEEAVSLLLSGCISPLPLHKILALQQAINAAPSPFAALEQLALAKTAVATASNLRFGPEVGVRGRKPDASVVEAWLANVDVMANDLRLMAPLPSATSVVFQGDARNPQAVVEPGSIDAVFTSPPYPNEKDYSRTTRLETVLLGFATNKADLQQIKRGLLRSNTRNVYKGDDDERYVENNATVQKIATEIEARRVALGKTSGFERLYPKVTRLYFGGMARHLAELRPLLRPGAYLGYVVGDQASYLRVMIRTGEILAEIATSLGYELVRIDLFRTRFATATKEMMREEVVVLRWRG